MDITTLDFLTPQQFYDGCYNAATSRFQSEASEVISETKNLMRARFAAELGAWGLAATTSLAILGEATAAWIASLTITGGVSVSAFVMGEVFGTVPLSDLYDARFATACEFIAAEQLCVNQLDEQFTFDAPSASIKSDGQINQVINSAGISSAFARERCGPTVHP